MLLQQRSRMPLMVLLSRTTAKTRMSNDSQADITYWLNAAGRYPLLPAERVMMIARQIQALPKESPKRRRLINTLVNHNLRLVARFVRVFMDRKSRYQWGSVETVDYLQQGAIGLTRAAELYDPARGYAFSTYANHWIRSAVTRYNMKSLSPVSVSESASRRAVFYKRNGYLRSGRSQNHLSPERIKRFLDELRNAYQYTSTDAKLTEDGGALADFIPDHSQNTEFAAYQQSIESILTGIGVSEIGCHTLIESYINGRTTKEIAADLGVTANKIKTEKRLATEIARQCPAAFEDAYIGGVTTAP